MSTGKDAARDLLPLIHGQGRRLDRKVNCLTDRQADRVKEDLGMACEPALGSDAVSGRHDSKALQPA